jgi:hypothetical protein
MRINVKSAATLLVLAATANSPRAAIISETITASVSNFTVVGQAVSPPVDPATIEFSITFDNSTGLDNQTVGLTLISSNLPLDTGFGFTYRNGTDILAVGGLGGNVVGGVDGTNDFSWVFGNISTATPTFFNFVYESTLAPLSLFESQTGAVSATPISAVPEPSSFALLAVGLGGIFLFRRKSRSRCAEPTPTL